MQRYRTRSAPAVEARTRAIKAKMAEEALLELERADMVNDSESRQKRAVENRQRLQRNTQRLRELDAQRFEVRNREALEAAELEAELKKQVAEEEKRLDSGEAMRVLSAIERAERNAERAKRVAEIQRELERERELEILADAELEEQRVNLANQRRLEVLISRRDAARRYGTEKQVDLEERLGALSRTREANAALRRVEVDLQSRIADEVVREKELTLARQIREKREDELERSRRRADRRALTDAEYADYCDELKSFWRVEENRANRLVERALSAKVIKAREQRERVERARNNHQRLKQQESAWQDLVETELAHRLGRVTRFQSERLRAINDTRAISETAQRELMRSRHRDRDSETFDKVDRDCRIFNHVVMRHDLNEPSWVVD